MKRWAYTWFEPFEPSPTLTPTGGGRLWLQLQIPKKEVPKACVLSSCTLLRSGFLRREPQASQTGILLSASFHPFFGRRALSGINSRLYVFSFRTPETPRDRPARCTSENYNYFPSIIASQQTNGQVASACRTDNPVEYDSLRPPRRPRRQRRQRLIASNSGSVTQC